MTPLSQVEAVIAKLERTGHPLSLGGGRPFNPDGGEAVELIRQLVREREELLARIDNIKQGPAHNLFMPAYTIG